MYEFYLRYKVHSRKNFNICESCSEFIFASNELKISLNAVIFYLGNQFQSRYYFIIAI